MKAAVYEGDRTFSVREIPTPRPGPGQVLVRVGYSAICGTDVHAYLYDIAPPGTVMGHEFSGTVVETGPGVTRWAVGDRVVGGGGSPPPGATPTRLREPRYNYRVAGYAERPLRAYAEYTVMDEWEPIAIPDGVSDEAAAMCEPCAVAVHAVRGSRLRLGDSAAILGAGPIGLLCLQVARAAGANPVIVSEPAPARVRAALGLGAAAVVDPTREDVIARMVELTGGAGPRIVFECAAARDTLQQAMDLAPRGGQVVLVAVPWEPVPVRPVDWMARETDLHATFGSDPDDWRIALELMRSGAVQLDPLLRETSVLDLDGIPAAFEQLVRPSTQVQVMVKP
jgi:(R,R)-butanediol dehydrogenase/meso-butanediol dehydrogenase/diacetyl reductase